MIPFHIWLSKAHVEAPTARYVISARILFKLGTCGFIRFSIPMFHGPLIVVESFVHYVDFCDYSRGVHHTLKAFS
jgi:NADH:ubiquinone oxidoreductase subunit 4 (subunit M)